MHEPCVSTYANCLFWEINPYNKLRSGKVKEAGYQVLRSHAFKTKDDVIMDNSRDSVSVFKGEKTHIRFFYLQNVKIYNAYILGKECKNKKDSILLFKIHNPHFCT